MKRLLAAIAAAAVAACGSVEVPRERYWRLDLPAAGPGPGPAALVLRVLDLQLGQALSGDCLLVADGPVRVRPQEFDRWVAPLDRLVTDAMVLGLSRTRLFSLVKDGSDSGGEDLSLSGRIVDFAEVAGTDGPAVRVAFDLALLHGDRPVFQDEFGATVRIGQSGAVAAVPALSAAMGQVVVQVAERIRSAAAVAPSR